MRPASSRWPCARRSTGWPAAQRLRRAVVGCTDDDTVDVFTSGRKMRLTCSPNIDVKVLKKGQTVRLLNEALTVVEAGTARPSARSARCARSSDGHQRWWSGTPTRSASWLAEPLAAIEDMPSQVDDGVDDDLRPRKLRLATRCWSTPRPATPSSASPRPRSRTWCSRRFPTSPQRYRRPDPADRADPRRGRAAVPAQGALPGVLAAPAQGCAALRPARLRQDADAKAVAPRWPRRWPRSAVDDAREAKSHPQHQGPELLNKFVGETERHIRLIFQRPGRRRPRAPR